MQKLAEDQRKNAELADRNLAEAVKQRAAEPNPRALIRLHNGLVAKLRELDRAEQDVTEEWNRLVGESKKLEVEVSRRWPRGTSRPFPLVLLSCVDIL